MDTEKYATAADIRSAFRAHESDSAIGQLGYGELWSLLQSEGIRIRGATPKNQRDAIYRALMSDPQIDKCGPGLFRLNDRA